MIGAVDIGGTKIAVGMVDDNGKVLSSMEAPTDPSRYSDGIELIAHMLRKTAQRARVELSGIGIGSTGPVDPMRGEFGDVDFLPGWRGKSPVKDLAQIFSGIEYASPVPSASLALYEVPVINNLGRPRTASTHAWGGGSTRGSHQQS